MSYWSHNPELLNQLIFEELVARGLADEDDDPFEEVERYRNQPVFDEVVMAADRNYWADKVDEAMIRRKEV